MPHFVDDAMAATALDNIQDQLNANSIINGHLVFVALSKACLLSDTPKLFPAEHTVLTVTEDMLADAAVITSMQDWKRSGFRFALDICTELDARLLSLADYVRINIPACQGALADLVHQFRKHPVKLIASHVETHAQHESCRQLGFDYVQGYFFCKPLATAEQLPLGADKAQLLHVLNQTMNATSPKELEYEIAHDLALSYQLLRYINSASVGLRRKVDSIGHALVVMGLNNLRVWVAALVISSISKGKCTALLHMALCRGRLLEQFAISQNNMDQKNDYFILGMFSLLDALLDQNINQIVASLSLPDLVSDGLFELASEPAIRLNIIRSMEQGDWVQLNALLASVDLDAEKIASVYAEAVQWTDEKIALINSPA